MKLFVRNSLSGEYYGTTGCWTPDLGLAQRFSSPEAALAQFPGTFHLLELVVQSEFTSSIVAVPLLTVRMPAAASRILETRWLD